MTKAQISAAAAALGRLTKGIPKTLTKEQRAMRRKQALHATACRVLKHKSSDRNRSVNGSSVDDQK